MFFLPPPSPLSPLTNVPPTSLTVKPLFTFLHTTNCREQIVFLDISCKKDPRKSLPFFHKILIHLECTTSFFYETFLASCVQRTVRDFVCLAYLCTLFWLRSFLLSLPPSSILGDGRGKMGRKCRQKIDQKGAFSQLQVLHTARRAAGTLAMKRLGGYFWTKQNINKTKKGGNKPCFNCTKTQRLLMTKNPHSCW